MHPPEEKSPDWRKAGEKARSIKDPNRLQAIGPNLGDYTQWVRLRAPTGRKVSRLEEGRRKGKKHKRSEPIANNRPESRGLHPVGALARTHRKKSLLIGGRQEKKQKA